MKKSASSKNCEKRLDSETWEVNATLCHNIKGKERVRNNSITSKGTGVLIIKLKT